MIICVFNHYFPHNSGFGNRCKREIEILSKLDDVTIVCRADEDQKLQDEFYIGTRKVKIVRFRATSEIVHRPDGYKGTGWYELKRNLDLLWGLLATLTSVMRQSSKPVELYCVTSPLTIPLLGLILTPFFGVKPKMVSFHDLEPELAMHLKKIPRNHWLVWLELKLEWLVCNAFKKVLVTTHAQAEILAQRTNTNLNKYCVIENVSDLSDSVKSNIDNMAARKSGAESKKFVIVYMSTISFDYTTDGLKEFLMTIKPLLKKNRNMEVKVLGTGEGLASLKEFIKNIKLENSVVCMGHVDKPGHILNESQVAIIPWKKDIMTATMLPTKLFEYLSLGLPVIVPNFGEFSRILSNGQNAVLYTSDTELVRKVAEIVTDNRLRTEIGRRGMELFDTTYRPAILEAKLISFYGSNEN